MKTCINCGYKLRHVRQTETNKATGAVIVIADYWFCDNCGVVWD